MGNEQQPDDIKNKPTESQIDDDSDIEVSEDRNIKLKDQFNRKGLNIRKNIVDIDGVKLGLALKKHSRSNDPKAHVFEGYLINHDNPQEIFDFTESAIELTDLQPDVPITFVYYGKSIIHSIYGMFQRDPIDKSKIDVVFIDSLAQDHWLLEPCKLMKIALDIFKGESDGRISDFQIITNFDRLQANNYDCCIIAIDGCYELSNATNYLPDGYKSVASYMRANQYTERDLEVFSDQKEGEKSPREKAKESCEKLKEAGFAVSKIPIRSARSMQSWSRLQARFSQNPEEASLATNKKGETTPAVVDKTKSEIADKKFNNRIQHKEQRLHEKAQEFMEGKSEEEIYAIINKHSVEGLKERVEEVKREHGILGKFTQNLRSEGSRVRE